MNVRFALGVTGFLAVALVVACSSDSEETPPAGCTKGAARACTGEGGCAGTQTCNADGQTFSACVCGATEGGPPIEQPDTGVPDTGVDAGDWAPRDLAGLVAWYDGSKGVVEDPTKPGKIFKWQDRSGKSNDATVGSATAPTIEAAAINGKGAVKCDAGSYLTIKDGETLKFGTGDYGIITIAKAHITENVGPTFFEKGIVAQITGEKSFRLITLMQGGGEAVVKDVPVDTYAVYIARGSQMEVRAAGKTGTGPKTTVDVNDTNPAYLCRGTTDAFTSIAEMMIVKGALSATDIAQAEKYAKAKYGL